MGCLNYKSLVVPEKNDDALFAEYWHEVLPEMLFTYTLDMDIEIPNEVLMKNYDFHKKCHEFNGSADSLVYFLNDEGYRGILKMDEKDFGEYIKKHYHGIISGYLNFYFEDGIIIIAIKCDSTKIRKTRDNYQLRIDKICSC